MSLKINIEHNFHDLTKMMNEISHDNIVGGTKRAMNDALRRSRVVVGKEIMKEIALSSSKVKARINIYKARGSSLDAIEGALGFSDMPISMLNFVVGNKSNIKQKGLKVKQRRKLKVRLKPGKTIKLKGAFIQKVKSQQVFRRKGQGPRVRKLGIKSIATIAFQRKIRPRIEEVFLKRFDREWRRQMSFRFQKTANKYSGSPMRLPR